MRVLVGRSAVLAVCAVLSAPLTGCAALEASQTYSCSGDGHHDVDALGSVLAEAFPEAEGKPDAVDDCDSSGKSSATLVVPGQVAAVEHALPTAWRCGHRRAEDAEEVFLRCTLDGWRTEVILELASDSEVEVYARPLAAKS